MASSLTDSQGGPTMTQRAKHSSKARANRGRRRYAMRAPGALTLALQLLWGPSAWALDPGALPSGGQVVSGSGDIGIDGSRMTVNQTSDRLITNWDRFDIGSAASVRFNQPDSSATALNRVIGTDVSQIAGQLSANGRVLLINPNGVLFSPTARVDVGGLVASTLQLADDDFLAGRYHFSGAGGSILNQGRITTAEGGVVAFLSPSMRNEGSIATPGGTTVLLAAEGTTLDFTGDGLIRYQLSEGTTHALAENSGTLAAEGGMVALSAQGVAEVAGGVVNNTGIVEARGLVSRNGKIILESGPGGQTRIAGSLDVASQEATGGQIQVTGETVSVESGARLDATGATGGGEVLVGGGWQGSGGIHQATTVTMARDATIDVSATGQGDGGAAVLWSDVHNPDSVTTVRGTILAMGAAAGGDGGRIETSGHRVEIDGTQVDAGAPAGQAGEWLIDPYNYDINTTDANWIATVLRTTNITIDTSLDNSGGVIQDATGEGNIQLLASIMPTGMTADTTLTLKAHNYISLNNFDIDATSGGRRLNVVLWADQDGSGNGSVILGSNSDIRTNGGHVYIGGGAGSTVWNGLTVPSGYAGSSNGSAEGIWLAQWNNIIAAGGSIVLKGKANTDSASGIGIWQGTGTFVNTTGSGTITYDGISYANQPYAQGIYLDDTSIIRNDSGAITLTGTCSGNCLSASNSQGIKLYNTAAIESSSGAISLTGNHTSRAGIYLQGAGTRIGKGNLGSSSSNITLTSDRLAVDGYLQSSGNMTIQPLNNGTTICVAANTPSCTMVLTDTFIENNLVDGFASITIGSTTSGYLTNTGVTSSLISYKDPLIFKSGDYVQIGNLEAVQGNNLTIWPGGGTSILFSVNLNGGRVEKYGAGQLSLFTLANPFGLVIYEGTVLSGGWLSDSYWVDVGASGTLNISASTETIGSLTGSGSVLLGSGTLTTGGNNTNTTFSGVVSGTGSLVKQGSGTFTLAGNNTYTGTTTISAGTLQIGAGGTSGALGSGNVTNNASLVFNRSNALTVANTISGTGSVTQQGSGTTTLTGSNTYTGTTTISAGTLQIGAGSTSGTLGAGDVTNNASLVFNRSDALTVANIISGTGSVTQQGGGTTTLTKSNSYTGTTTLNAGTLQAGAYNVLSDSTAVTVNGGATYALGNYSDTIGSLAGAGSVTIGDATLTTGANNASTTFSGVISGNGGRLTKTGSGIFTLSGANTYTDATTINAGTLRAGTNNALSNSTAVTVASGATYDLNDKSDTIGSLAGAGSVTLGSGTLTTGASNASTTFSGVISETGSLTKTGSGTFTLSGANSYTGATTVSAGTLQAGAHNVLSNSTAVTVASGATFDLNNYSDTIGSLAGAGSVTLGSGTLATGASNASTTFSGVISETGSLTKTGSGTFTISGENTYAGTTTVSAGTLAVAHANALGSTTGSTTVTSGSTLDVQNVAVGAEAITLNGGVLATSTGSSSLSGAVTLGTDSTVNVAGTQLTLSGAIGDGANTFGLTKTGSGTLILAGDNTYDGTTTVSVGTLQIGAGSTTGTLGSGNVTNNASLAFNRSNAMTVSNVISGTGSVSQQGSGTTTLTGSNSYSGTTTLSAGTLQIGSGGASGTLGSGSVTNNASLVFNRSDAITVANVISGSGSLTKLGSDTMTLSGNNSYAGTTTVSAGTLAVAHANALGSTTGSTTVTSGSTLDVQNVAVGAEAITLNGGVLVTSTGSSSLSGAVTLGTDSTVNVAGTQLTLSGAIGDGANTFGLTKTGSGTLILAGDNTYDGTTAVSAGTLAVAHANALGSTTGSTTVTSGATLDLRNIALGAEAIILNGGILAASTGSSSLSGAMTLGADSTVSVAGTQLTLSGTIGDGANTYGLTKTGSGIAVLSGSNTYDGTTAVSAGTLAVAHANALGSTTGSTAVASGATLDLRNIALGAEAIILNGGILAASTGSSSLSGAVTLGADSTVSVAGTQLTLSGTIGDGTDTFGLTKTGSGIAVLSGSNTYDGTTTVSAGTLAVAHANALGTTTGGTSVASGATLDLQNVAAAAEAVTLTGEATLATSTGISSHAGTITLESAPLSSPNIDVDGLELTLSGTIVDGTGATDWDKAGAGTLVLSGNNTYTKKTNVNAGTLAATHANALGSSTQGTSVASGATLDLRNVSVGGEPLLLSGGTLATSTGTSSLSGTVALGADSAISVAGTQLTLSGAISDSGNNYALGKTGSGIAVLSGSNTYGGLTTVSAGTLVVTNALGLGNGNTGTTVVNGATLELQGVAIATESITLNGAGVGAEGALKNSATSSIAVALTVNTSAKVGGSGSLTLGAINILDGQTLTLGNGSGLDVTTGAIAGVAGNAASNLTVNAGATSLGLIGTDIDVVSVTSGSLALAGVTANSLSLTTTGNVTQSGALAIASTTSINAAANSVTLDHAGNDFAGTVSIASAGTVTLTDSNALTLGAASTSGDVTLTAGSITLTGVLNAGANRVTLASTGAVTDSGSGSITAGSLALTGAGGVYTLDSTANNVTTLAADTGRISYTDADALTIGTVNPTGITATGPVLIETLTGDLTLSQNITTTDTSSSAVILNAGKSTAAGTATGGNIIVSGTPSLSMGAGGRATLYSGSISDSTGLTDLVGSGSSNFRYNSDETASNYTTPLGAGTYAVYREQPTVTITANNDSKTYDGNAYSGGNGVTYSGFVNGDTSADLGGTLAYGGTSQGAVNVGGYTIVPSGHTSGLGYALSNVSGTLTINPVQIEPDPVLTAISGSLTGSVSKVYDGTNIATLAPGNYVLRGWVGSDGATVTKNTGTYDNANVGSNKTVTVSLARGDYSPLGGTNLSNYSLPTSISGNIGTITAAPLTITANDASKVYDGLAYSGGNGVTYSGFVNGEFSTVLSGTLIYGGSSQGAIDVGSYGIIPSGLTSDNYAVSFHEGELNIVNSVYRDTLSYEASAVRHASLTALDPGEASVADPIIVQLLNYSPESGNGHILVSVPGRLLMAGTNFEFPLPMQAMPAVEDHSITENISLADGRPLPAWLQYDAKNKRFECRRVPTDALPLKAIIRSGGRDLVIDMVQDGLLVGAL